MIRHLKSVSTVTMTVPVKLTTDFINIIMSPSIASQSQKQHGMLHHLSLSFCNPAFASLQTGTEKFAVGQKLYKPTNFNITVQSIGPYIKHCSTEQMFVSYKTKYVLLLLSDFLYLESKLPQPCV